MTNCSPPYARSTGTFCGCNCNCCPPEICNNPKVLWALMRNCEEINIYETDVICENGVNKIYKRNIKIRLRDWRIDNVQENCCY